MKNIFESITLIFGVFGIIYLIYLLYLELKNLKESNNKDRLFLVLILIFIITGIIKDKLLFLFDI